jgi:hypothetical protein
MGRTDAFAAFFGDARPVRPLSCASRPLTAPILKAARGRIDAFAKRSANDCYLRIAVAVVSALNVRFLAKLRKLRRLDFDLRVHVVEARVAAWSNASGVGGVVF